MGVSAGSIAFYAYIIPFYISTLGGAIISVFVIEALKKAGVLNIFMKYNEA